MNKDPFVFSRFLDKPFGQAVETFPARPRYPSQANNGGTSLRSHTLTLIDNREKTVTVPWSQEVSGRETQRASTCPRPLSPFAAASPRRRRPAIVGLRRVSWTGWERLYKNFSPRPAVLHRQLRQLPQLSLGLEGPVRLAQQLA